MSSVTVVLFIVLCSLRAVECKPHVFFCDFESNLLCGMQNGSPVDPTPSAINFTVRSFGNVTYPDLGPPSYHSFLYWSRSDDPPQAELINGQVHTGRFNQTENMCVQFSYYIESTGVDNGTWVDISAGGCYGASLYFIEQDHSNGWQVVTVPLHDYSCAISLYITVNQRTPARVAIAFDYIIVDLCEDLDNSTTTPAYNRASIQTWKAFLVILFFYKIIRITIGSV
jgi:hypothetical protein